MRGSKPVKSKESENTTQAKNDVNLTIFGQNQANYGMGKKRNSTSTILSIYKLNSKK